MAGEGGKSGKRKRSDESISDGLESPAKRTAVTSDSDGTPTVAVDLAERSRDGVFEAVYRELFERVHDHDCAAGPDNPPNDQVQEALAIGVEGKFAKVCNPRHGREPAAGGSFRHLGNSQVLLSTPGQKKTQKRLSSLPVRN